MFDRITSRLHLGIPVPDPAHNGTLDDNWAVPQVTPIPSAHLLGMWMADRAGTMLLRKTLGR